MEDGDVQQVSGEADPCSENSDHYHSDDVESLTAESVCEAADRQGRGCLGHGVECEYDSDYVARCLEIEWEEDCY